MIITLNRRRKQVETSDKAARISLRTKRSKVYLNTDVTPVHGKIFDFTFDFTFE